MLGNGVVGISKEVHDKWERRAPLSPSHCAKLLHGNHKSKVSRIIVQPCTKRVFRNSEYEDVGCEISEDLSECGLILGVKQPKLGMLLPERAYSFFSHTHKSQPQNMPLLDEVLKKKISLYDYELIVGDDGKRLVAFGKYAGRAGMVDFLRGLGERFLCLGYSTPFLSLGSSYMYSSLSAAKGAVVAVGDEISRTGFPLQICPLVVVLTGSGNVSRGVQDILRLLPHSYIDPTELCKLVDEKKSTKQLLEMRFQVYICVTTSQHMVEPNDKCRKFDKAEYYDHPEQYHPVFHENIAPYASVIVNCMYWEQQYPRLLTNVQLHDIFKKGRGDYRMIGIADITCDIGGSIECVNTTSTVEAPFYRYDPISGSYQRDLEGEGILIMSIDLLPTEFPKEATKHFGDVLYSFVTSMAHAHHPDDCTLSLKRACIAHNGRLTTAYKYIARMRECEAEGTMIASLDKKEERQFKELIHLSGHLFDHFLINEALDIIEKEGGNFRLLKCEVGQTNETVSHAEIEVMAASEEKLSYIVNAMSTLSSRADQQVEPTKSKHATENGNALNDNLFFKILILGAGRMCEPAVRYLAKLCHRLELADDLAVSKEKTFLITVGSLYIEDAHKVTAGMPNTTAIQIDINSGSQLRTEISKVAVVISLLPPDCHVSIASVCVELGKHLVASSYVSKDMLALDEKAKSAGVTLLCEMGLDPGIDHMMAMKMIDEAHLNGGHVESFTSYCGGLPSPSAANNPIGYKFSWNPRGAIKAGRNPAVYKQDGQMVHVEGDKIFASAIPFGIPNLPAFALERLPNRDSLVYGEIYGISKEASTIFRATLRYSGFSEIMDVFGKLGYFKTDTYPMLVNLERPTLLLLLKKLVDEANHNYDIDKADKTDGVDVKLERWIASITSNTSVAERVTNCIRYLGLDAEIEVATPCKTPFDVLCWRMEEKLQYGSSEQDLVLLYHELEIHYKNGQREHRSATLLTFGEFGPRKPLSAMACTVGYTAAIGAQLLLLGKIKSTGVIRPLQPEVYVPGLEILDSLGIHFEESSTPPLLRS